MPHLLAIGHRWPELQACSASGHLLDILKGFIAQGWHVSFTCPAEPAAHHVALAELGISTQNCMDDSAWARLPAADAVLFDRFSSEERFGQQVRQQYPNALCMLLTSGLESLCQARQQLLRTRLVEGLDPNDFRTLFATPGPELYRHMAPSATTQRELAAVWRCDLALVGSEVEIDLLINGFGVPEYLLHHCPPVVEAPSNPRPYAERANFVSVGDFADPAHFDALLWIRHNLWPMLRRQLPQAQLHLYGANPSAKALALHHPDDGLHVLGPLADATDVMSQAKVCLAPLRFGAGVDRQLLEALRCATPSVTTPLGAQGFGGQQAWPGSIEGTAEGLAKAAAQLYADQGLWQRAQDACTPLLRRGFDPVRQRAALSGRVEHSLGHLDDLRLFNFTGAMLRRSPQG